MFVEAVEPGLRRALVAGFGPEVGRDATVDALAWAWQHWARVEGMHNPGGYLYRVGRTAACREVTRSRRQVPVSFLAELAGPGSEELSIEPGLDRALGGLSPRQRTAVLLVHGYGYPLRDAADLMGCSMSSLRNHVRRALRNLRAQLGESDER